MNGLPREELPHVKGLPRVVIVGGGFAGIWCARRLAKAPVAVTLIDTHAYHTFFPLLYQVGAAELGPTAITHPIRSMLRGTGVHFRRGQVRDVELRTRRVRLEPEAHRSVRPTDLDIEYDYLVLATGSVANFFGVAGAREHAFPMRTMPEALRLRRQILDCFEAASVTRDPTVRQALLTFVVVGGGATGVEYAGALSELVRGALHPDYPTIPSREPRIVLLEAGNALIPAMEPRLRLYADERLRDRGVDVRFGARVAEVLSDRVRLASGNEIPSRTIVWTAGIRGDPIVEGWGLPTTRAGRVLVDDCLRVDGRSDVFAAGDLSYLEAGERLCLRWPRRRCNRERTLRATFCSCWLGRTRFHSATETSV